MRRTKNILIIGLLIFGLLPYVLGASFGSGVKIVYQITGEITASTSIASTTASIGGTVVIAKSSITHFSYAAGGAYGAYNVQAACTISSTTQITVYAGIGSGTSTVRYCAEVTEYY